MKIQAQPVDAAPFYARLYAAHIDVLGRLAPEQWALPTVCAGWSVKDVALHMLADDVGWVSAGRDGHRERVSIAGWDDLIRFINARNEQWVQATRRMSARLLCDLAPILGSMIIDYVDMLDPNAPGPVIHWAGPDPVPLWMQIGRELTERWMHHQHICDAVGITSLKEADIVHAVLDTFVRALPYTYRAVTAPEGSAITLWLIGDGGGSWSIAREDERWQLYRAVDVLPLCTVSLPVEIAWRLFTKAIDAEQARREAIIEGDEDLAEPVLHMVSILA